MTKKQKFLRVIRNCMSQTNRIPVTLSQAERKELYSICKKATGQDFIGANPSIYIQTQGYILENM